MSIRFFLRRKFRLLVIICLSAGSVSVLLWIFVFPYNLSDKRELLVFSCSFYFVYQLTRHMGVGNGSVLVSFDQGFQPCKNNLLSFRRHWCLERLFFRFKDIVHVGRVHLFHSLCLNMSMSVPSGVFFLILNRSRVIHVV